jgi:selenide, water dikinase
MPMPMVVLAGGGHTHVGVLRQLARAPLRSATIALVNPDPVFTYSGMVPGVVAGHYPPEACQVDLARLCAKAGVTLIQGRVVGLDAAARTLQVDPQGPLTFDALSLDIGASPDMSGVPGAQEHAVSVRPLAGLIQHWSGWMRRRLQGSRGSAHVVVAGGGVAGVEIALAMRHALGQQDRSRHDSVTVVTDGFVALHPAGVRRRLERALRRAGIGLADERTVVQVAADGITCDTGERWPADLVIWATAAAAPAWLRTSQLTLDRGGFVLVDSHLQSVSHPSIFAAGDVAALVERPLPKAGIFAVRQGPVLDGNLRRHVAGRPLLRYEPQRRWLSLISLGERRAIGSYGAWSWEGALSWRLKDWIDRRWVVRG